MPNSRQHVIICSANCYANERDRYNNAVTDPESPRQRWQNVVDMEEAGGQQTYVEFASDGTSQSTDVVIDQVQFEATSPP